MKDENFMNAWRASDFYDWVMETLDEEMKSSYVKEAIILRSQEGNPMDDAEIGQAMRAEVQTCLRLKSIREIIE